MSSITTTNTTRTTITIRQSRSSKRRTFLPLSDAITLTGKLFNPNLKPWRPFRVPVAPSLRASQLPPPCAEVDERPRRRVRRFMLWQDKVPPLRLVVLDPRKRGHLRRFNVFQIPSNPQPTRGIRSWSGDLKTHKAWPPIQPIPRTLQRAPTDRAIRAVTPTGIVPTQAGGVIAPVVNTPIDVPTTKSPLPVNNTALPSTPRLPAIRPHASVPPFVRLPAAMGARQAQRVRSSPESRRLDRAKLLQHLFVLEQQAERRWRLAMDYMVTKMLIFEEAHIDQTVSDNVSSTTNEKPIWTKTPDPAVIIQWLGFMSDVRKWGNVWPHLELAQRDLPESEKIRPVRGLNQARQRVKEAKRKREEMKRAKIAKIKSLREAKANALAGQVEGGPLIGPVNRGAGPSMIIPRKTSPVLRVTNPAPAPLSRQQREKPVKTHSSSSDSSHSERIVTPPTSIAGPSSPIHPTSPIIDTTPAKLRAMGLNSDIPDEIAHHLADMLTKFQAIGLEKAQRAKEVIDSPVLTPMPKLNGGRRRRKARHTAQQMDLEVSIDSDSTGSDVSDGLSLGPSNDKASEVGSWMTGDLNMDEDTRAMMSGAGTDTGSAM